MSLIIQKTNALGRRGLPGRQKLMLRMLQAEGARAEKARRLMLLKKRNLLNLLAMQVLLTTPIPIHPSSQMQELTGSLIQVPPAT